MRCFIALAAFVSLVASQGRRPPWLDNLTGTFNQNKDDYTIDYVHNYRFEDHTNNGYHLLVAISDTPGESECHLIEIDSSWESYLQDDAKLYAITEEIYTLIDTHALNETTLTRDELRNKYGDTDALVECFNHAVYLLDYSPSAAIATM